MKRNVLSLVVACLCILVSSCQKDELTTASTDGNAPGIQARGGGEFSATTCGTNVANALLQIEKDGKNNSFIIQEGTVMIGNAVGQPGGADYVYADILCKPGYVIKTVEMWVGPKGSAPVTSNGSPKVGWFQSSYNNLADPTSFRAKVTKNQITCGADMIVMVRATVYNHNTEVSWGTGLPVIAGGTAMYVPFKPCWCN